MRLNLILTRSTCLYRTFSTTASAQAVDKSALAILRKKTGYTFSNCKKALEECGADLPKAEAWLKAQAQTLGWAKASQLQDRVVAQGLVGLKYSPEDGTGVLVEINCETDFVARNAKFHELVANVADACVRELELKPIDGASYHKVRLGSPWIPGPLLPGPTFFLKFFRVSEFFSSDLLAETVYWVRLFWLQMISVKAMWESTIMPYSV
jgi:Elongation factor TS